MLERVWDHAMLNHLKVNIRDTPVLLAEKTYNSPSARQKMCELMFETFDVPAIFMSKDAVLSCYAVGRTSGLVIDCGASGTVVSPVHDGWTEVKGISRGKVGGRYMDAFMLQMLEQQHSLSRPLYRLNKTINTVTGEVDVSENKAFLPGGLTGSGEALKVHPSYDAYMNLEMARDMKDSVCRMPPEALTSDPDTRFLNIPTTPYELPDGTLLETGLERFQPPELLMDPYPSFFAATSKMVETSKSKYLLDSYLSPLTPGALPGSFDSLPKLIVDSAFRCEPDIQAGLVANLIVTGGNSCFEGTAERIKSEVEKLIHPLAPAWKVKHLAAGQTERALCPWLGGSIIASLGSFHEMWFSKSEYDEFGASLISAKCP
mmetsp:Transcript_7308/g.12268  ORF Transcript_7308/g.12268 Transcript_7308/m.12268 type:complete len:374 (-) Transcript_7308:47-1168(-)